MNEKARVKGLVYGLVFFSLFDPPSTKILVYQRQQGPALYEEHSKEYQQTGGQKIHSLTAKTMKISQKYQPNPSQETGGCYISEIL